MPGSLSRLVAFAVIAVVGGFVLVAVRGSGVAGFAIFFAVFLTLMLMHSALSAVLMRLFSRTRAR